MFYIIPPGENAVLQMLNESNTLGFFPPVKGLYCKTRSTNYFEESTTGVKEKIPKKRRKEKEKSKAMQSSNMFKCMNYTTCYTSVELIKLLEPSVLHYNKKSIPVIAFGSGKKGERQQ